MKKFLYRLFAVLLLIILFFFAFCTVSIFLKAPMLVSGYSSSFVMQFNSWFIVLGLALLVLSFILSRKATFWKPLFRLGLLLAALVLAGQVVFMAVMLKTANKYGTEVDMAQTFKGVGGGNYAKETYHYLTIYGEKQEMDVYYPKVKGNKPSIAIVNVHGGAFIMGDKKDVLDFPEWFTDRGYTFFSVNYPLAKEDRQTWQTAANSIATALSFIEKNSEKFNIYPDRIILLGGSAGGAIVLQTDLGLRNGNVKSYSANQPPLPAATIAFYPPVSISELYQKMDEGKTVDLHEPAKKYLGGSPTEFPERYKDVNLIDHLSKGIAPTLIITGDIDHVVNVEAIRRFVERSKTLKLPVEYMEIPYGEHAFNFNSHSVAGQITLKGMENFLKKNALD